MVRIVPCRDGRETKVGLDAKTKRRHRFRDLQVGCLVDWGSHRESKAAEMQLEKTQAYPATGEPTLRGGCEATKPSARQSRSVSGSHPQEGERPASGRST